MALALPDSPPALATQISRATCHTGVASCNTTVPKINSAHVPNA
ncbi:hypothetical protein PSAC2689_110102 [Paraburkholderia sacchari]